MIIHTSPRENTARFLQASRDEIAVYRVRISPTAVATKTVEVAAVDEVVIWRPVVSGPALVVSDCGTTGRCAGANGGCPDHVGAHAGKHTLILGGIDVDGHRDDETLTFADGEGIVYREQLEVDPWDVDRARVGEQDPWTDCAAETSGGSCYLKLGHPGPCDPDNSEDVTPERVTDDLSALVDATQ